MPYRSSVSLTDIKQPVENIVVIFGVEFDLVGAVEDIDGLLVDEPGGPQESAICSSRSSCLGAVYQARLS